MRFYKPIYKMNVVKRLDQYNENYVHFFEPIKNNVMDEGTFVRILYSTPLFSLNGIYLFFQMNDVAIEKYYNKYKCSFNFSTNREVCDRLGKIEDTLLKKISIKNKVAQHKIYEQLMNGNIKIFCDGINKQPVMGFLLRISGIWETNNQYGVTYKFSKVDTL